MNTERLKDVLAQARRETGKVIIGQDDVIEKALIAIFTGNHALIEGVPGVAKTLLVRTLARVLGCEFARIQFTPDLMPADITGTNVFNLQRNEFSLIKGPVFTSFLLADEINRAPAKTQSALLQAMQERVVTIDRENAPAAAELHRVRHAEPDRIRGHLSAARGAEGPLHAQDHHAGARPRRGTDAGAAHDDQGRAGNAAGQRRRADGHPSRRICRTCASSLAPSSCATN